MNLTDWENLIKKTRSNFIKDETYYIDLAVEKNIKIIEDTSNFIKKVRADAYHEFFLKDEYEFSKNILKKLSDLTEYNKDEDNTHQFINKYFEHIYRLCLSNTQSRRSRSGDGFETLIEKILIHKKIPYQGKSLLTENNLEVKEIDFIIPNKRQYKKNKKKVIAISCKTSLRERWEQVVAEKDHIGIKEILLFTIGEDLKKDNKRITEKGIVIVTFPEIKKKYPKDDNIITFEDALNNYIPKFLTKKTKKPLVG
jgi:hypothetical protein